MTLFSVVLKLRWKIDPTKKGGSGLLTPHVCTQAAFDLFGQVKDGRRFWIPDISWILQPLFYKWDRLNSTPMAECIAGHIQTECSFFGEDLPVLCMWGLAHVCSLRNVVLFFTRHLWLFFEVFFPDSFSYCYEKPNMSCFFDYSEKICCEICPSRLSGKIIKSGFGCVR